MRRRSLFTQVLAVNAVLLLAIGIVAGAVAGVSTLRSSPSSRSR